MVVGKADDGKRANPWRTAQADIGGRARAPVSSAVLWIFGLGAILAVAALGKGKEKGR